ncbi:MAG: class I SAM-dependent methyltransferase [Opitutales bacterium]
MRLTDQVHQELRQLVRQGDVCIDATAGNGHDTLVLAKLVGPAGRIIAVDLQAQAIHRTRTRLEQNAARAQCALVHGNHGAELIRLCAEYTGRVRAITFNLGYLPGSDKTVITDGDTTLKALDAAATLLSLQGAVLLTAYRGHPGGIDEATRVEAWMRQQATRDWAIECFEPQSGKTGRVPPILWIARKQK